MGPLKGWRRWVAAAVGMILATVLVYAFAGALGSACLSMVNHKSGGPIALLFVAFSAMIILLLVSMGPVLGLVIATWMMRVADRRMKIPIGQCQQCGYDLTGNVSGRCPECGRTIVCP